MREKTCGQMLEEFISELKDLVKALLERLIRDEEIDLAK